jgi:hypothetical protein
LRLASTLSTLSNIIILSNRIHLGQEYALQPLDGDIVTNPSIWAAYIVPITNLPKFWKEPLGLELFSLENDARAEIFTRGGDGVDYCDPRSTAIALPEGFLVPSTRESIPSGYLVKKH